MRSAYLVSALKFTLDYLVDVWIYFGVGELVESSVNCIE